MNTIDERTVKMSFDNKQFESGVQQSLGTLSKLKNALNLTSSVNSLKELDTAGKNFSLDNVGSAIAAIGDKFSSMEIVAINVLSNLATQASKWALNMADSLSLKQVREGWSKYADKTSAVQTIMASTAQNFEDTGEQMAYVNDQLGKLNWFTDETSYAFLDMVNNIGKFTSNNVELDKSVTAMQGISTWAAISGAGISGASRAMYNLAQAISMGSVKLMDWKSIELANMGTVEFKQTAMDTAVALGTMTKSADGVYRTLEGTTVTVENFRETLKDTWFTSEVLLDTLGQYGGFTDELYSASETTGLTATELLDALKQYEEGTKDLVAQNEEIAKTNDLLSETSTKYSVSVENLTEKFGELSKTEKEAGSQEYLQKLKDISSETGIEVSELREIMEQFRKTEGKTTQSTAEAAESFEFLKDISAETGAEMPELISVMEKLSSSELDLGRRAFQAAQEAKTFKEAIDATKDAASTGWLNVFEKIFGDYEEAKKLWTGVSEELYDIFVGPLETINELLDEWRENSGREDLFGGLGKIYNTLKSIVETAKSAIKFVFPVSSKSLLKISSTIANIGEKFEATFGNEEFLEKVRFFFGTIANVVKGIETVIVGPIKKAVSVVSGVLDHTFKSVKGYLDSVNEKIATGNFLKQLWFDTDNAGKFLIKFEHIADRIGDIFEFIGLFGKEVFSGVFDQVQELFAPLKKLGDSIHNLTGELFGFMKQSQKLDINKFFKVLTPLKNTVTNIARIFKNLAIPAVETFTKIFDTGAKPIKSFGDLLGGVLESALTILEKVTARLADISEQIRKSTFIQSIIENVGNLLLWIKSIFDDLKNGVASLDKVFNSDLIARIFDALTKNIHPLERLQQIFESIINTLGPIVSKLWELSKLSFAAVTESISTIIDNSDIGDVLSGGASVGIAVALGNLISSLTDATTTVNTLLGTGSSIFDKFLAILNAPLNVIKELKESLTSLFGSTKDAASTADSLIALGKTLLMFAGAMFIVSIIDADRLGDAFATVSTSLIELVAALKQIQNLTANPFKSVSLALITIGVSLLIMSYAVTKMASVDKDKLDNASAAMVGVYGVLLLMANLAKRISGLPQLQWNPKLINNIAKSFVQMAVAFFVMSVVLKILGSMNETEIKQGILAIGGIGAIFIILARILSLPSFKPVNLDILSNAFIKFSIALIPFALVVKILATLPIDEAAIAMGSIVVFSFLLAGVGAIFKKSAGSINAFASAIGKFSVGLIPFAIVMKVLSSISWDQALVAMGSIVVFSFLLAGVGAIFKDSGRSMNKFASAIGKFSVGLIPFAIVMKVLSSISWDQALVAMGSIVVFSFLLAGVGAIFKDSGRSMNKFASAIGKFSVSLIPFAIVMKVLSSIPWDQALVAMGSIVVFSFLLAGVGAIFKDSGRSMNKFASAIGKFSVSLIPFAAVMVILSSIPWQKALLAMGYIVGFVTIFSGVAALFKEFKLAGSLLKVAVSLTALSVAILLFGASLIPLVGVITLLSMIKPEELWGSIGAMAVILAAIAGAAILFSKVGGMLISGVLALVVTSAAVSVSLAMIAGAFSLLGLAIQNFADIKIGQVLLALGTLVGTILILGGASVLLAPVIPLMLMLGVAMAAAGAGLFLTAEALQILTVALPAFVTVLPGILNNIADSLRAIAAVIVGTFAMVLDTVKGISLELIDFVISFVVTFVANFISAFAENADTIINGIVVIGEAIIMGLTVLIPEVVAFIYTLLDAILVTLPDVMFKLGKALILSIDQLFEGLWAGMKEAWPGFTNALQTIWEKIKEWALAIPGKVKAWFQEKIEDVKNIGKNILEGLWNGIQEGWGLLRDGVLGVVNSMIGIVKDTLGINSPSKVAEGLGEFWDIGLANGLVKDQKTVEKSSANVGNGLIDAFANSTESGEKGILKNITGMFTSIEDTSEAAMDNTTDGIGGALDKIIAMVNGDMDFEPTITPVIDTSEVENGIADISSMFSGIGSPTLSESLVGNISSSGAISSLFGSSENQNGGGILSSVVNYTQNNYSPKALSATDIYRQTHNQISRMKMQIDQKTGRVVKN